MATPTQALGTVQPMKVDPTREYVSGGSLFNFAKARALSNVFDELTQKVDGDIYDKMMNDPEVASSIWLLKNSTLADGVQILPSIADEKADGYAKAKEIADFCETNLKNLQRPLLKTLEMMLDALVWGNKVAEQVYERGTGKMKGKLVLKALKVKERRSLAFVVDPFKTVLGFVYAAPNSASIVNSMSYPDGSTILPREKFAVLSFREKDEDPRGNSWLRPSYNGYNLKQLNWPQYLTFLLRCAVPGLIGVAAENAPDEILRDANGAAVLDSANQPITITAVQALLNALIQFANNIAVTVPHGADVKPLEVKSNGEAFDKAIEIFNKEITKGILYQTLATSDATHQTKSSTEEQMGIVELIAWYLKGSVAQMIQSDILKPLVRYNYGDEAADEFLPTASLGDASRKDWEKAGDVVDKLLSNEELSPSQKQFLMTVIGLPSPTKEEMQERTKQKEKMQEQMSNGNDTGKEDGDGKSDKTVRPGTRPDERSKAA
jgi:hypothetical protein